MPDTLTLGSQTPATASVGTLVVGPAPRWRVLTWAIFAGFVAFAALILFLAATKAPAGQTVAPSGVVMAAVLVAAGAGLRALMARRSPHVRFTPEGVSGVGLPVEIAWPDVRGAQVVAYRIGVVTQMLVEPVMDDAATERYMARLSAVNRVAWQSNRIKGLPVLSLNATHLDRSADDVAGLVREYAARYGPTRAPVAP